MSYQEYSEVPVYEQAVWENGVVINTKAVLIWAGKNGVVPPPVGEKIKVTMNGLGDGVVVGYFGQDGYLGLRVKLDSPPEWYVKQNKGNPVGHIFGPEFKPLEKYVGPDIRTGKWS